MKTIIFAVTSLLFVNMTRASNEKYIDTMKDNIQSVYRANSIEELQTSVNAFERIATTEKDKWEPQYYAAFGYVLMATRESNASKKDAYLDQAMEAVKKATAIAPNESEIVTMEGFVHTIRLTVDPASRGQQYSTLATKSLSKAVSLNPENPRALSLLGQMQFGTARFFGSSTSEACATINKALEKFDTDTSKNPLAPTWGKEETVEVRKSCGQ
jgi:Flp pilus assembly protein TadD